MPKSKIKRSNYWRRNSPQQAVTYSTNRVGLYIFLAVLSVIILQLFTVKNLFADRETSRCLVPEFIFPSAGVTVWTMNFSSFLPEYYSIGVGTRARFFWFFVFLVCVVVPREEEDGGRRPAGAVC
jgi:hypothetical protein